MRKIFSAHFISYWAPRLAEESPCTKTSWVLRLSVRAMTVWICATNECVPKLSPRAGRGAGEVLIKPPQSPVLAWWHAGGSAPGTVQPGAAGVRAQHCRPRERTAAGQRGELSLSEKCK